MTVLMTVNQREPLIGTECRIEWQGLAPGDEVAARLVTAEGGALLFPATPVPGLRRQPWSDGVWLLDAAALPAGWRRLDLLVRAPAVHHLSLGLVMRAAEDRGLQHPGLQTVAGTEMAALSIARVDGGLTVLPQQVPYDPAKDPWSGDGPEPPHVEVPEPLQEAAALAAHRGLVRTGEAVTAVLDLSASMRPRLVAGTVAGVLAGLQALAGAARRPDLSVMVVSDRTYGPWSLGLADDAEEFLRARAREIGLHTGGRAALPADPDGGLVVAVTDQEGSAPAGRGYRIVLAPPDPGRGVAAGAAGTVVVAEARLDAVSVVRALAHASPAA